MTKTEVLDKICSVGLVPVLRAPTSDQALRLAEVIADAGVTVMEVTMTIPYAPRLIARLNNERPDMLVGAGTVLDAQAAQRCLDNGAKFIVSPSLHEPTVELCRQLDVAVLPGALTPTEILNAWQCGADVVKVFPANAMGGANYLRSIRAPLPHIKLIPTGGVSLHTAKDFLAAGAFALGVGADLVDVAALERGNATLVTSRAKHYLEIVREFRAQTACA